MILETASIFDGSKYISAKMLEKYTSFNVYAHDSKIYPASFVKIVQPVNTIIVEGVIYNKNNNNLLNIKLLLHENSKCLRVTGDKNNFFFTNIKGLSSNIDLVLFDNIKKYNELFKIKFVYSGNKVNFYYKLNSDSPSVILSPGIVLYNQK